MILAACGGRGHGNKDAEGLARAESREGSGKGEMRRVDRKEGGMGRGGWQRGEGDRKEESGRGQRGGGDEEGDNVRRRWKGWHWLKGGGKMGREQQGGGKGERGGEGEKKGQEGGEISQMDMMGCLGGHRL